MSVSHGFVLCRVIWGLPPGGDPLWVSRPRRRAWVVQALLFFALFEVPFGVPILRYFCARETVILRERPVVRLFHPGLRDHALEHCRRGRQGGRDVSGE